MNRIKFSPNGYGDHTIYVLISVGGELVWREIGIIEQWSETAQHKYAVYITGSGKITDKGFDVFSLKVAKEVVKKYITDNNVISDLENK